MMVCAESIRSFFITPNSNSLTLSGEHLLRSTSLASPKPAVTVAPIFGNTSETRYSICPLIVHFSHFMSDAS